MNRSSDTPDRSVLLKELEALSLRLALEEAEMIASMPNTAIEQELIALTLNSATGVDRGQVQVPEPGSEITAKDTFVSGGHVADVSLSGQAAASHKRPRAEHLGGYMTVILRAAIRFFLFLSKTDVDVISDVSCTRLTRMSRTSMGVTVFLAGVAAFLSGTYALSTAFDGYAWGLFAALTLGFLYGCLFLLIGREMVGSQSKVAVLVKVPLAISICFIVAIPLEMKFLEDSINKQLVVASLSENRSGIDRMQSKLNELDARKAELRESVNRYHREVERWDEAMEAETVGRQLAGRTGKAGQGPVYKEAERNRDASAAALAQYEMELKRYGELEEEERKRIGADYKVASIPQTKDFLTRYEALDQLKSTWAGGRPAEGGRGGVFFVVCCD